ncbi:ATP-dependent RNA helicase dbp10 [Neolecta irregularis DAH-3]|uniref:RNA helicase n=1 Tax=Neolecta irregularis (strain DAH-3) TaxID=1198029 RepID=A0A1U7LPB2_NEOID|nr:ATP-dependent RNA helicase dbp10 [Neolecta irregularis DAH-3]|eukprot:OLL24361.1 ATP-dependent RNA helicase dbp10 [Neolecta irregularis DAH-3]
MSFIKSLGGQQFFRAQVDLHKSYSANPINQDMVHRAESPADSEHEVDISEWLTASAKQNTQKFISPGELLPQDSDEDEEFISNQRLVANRKTKGQKIFKGGAFQTMGLNQTLLKAITHKGFKVPTPIQRKTIPLLLQGRDVVGMARTGSGKTAAFVIPMIEKLKTHTAKAILQRVGARAIIMSPSRELAIQSLKVVRELGKGTDLKSALLVGGDSLEDQFGLMVNNPDMQVALVFFHLILFEMGFASQLSEVLYKLPDSRQTLLFSATLPKSLVEFAKAGLQEPILVRLDVDNKISTELESAFFSIKSADKEGSLLYLLQEVIQIPLDLNEQEQNIMTDGKKKRKHTQGQYQATSQYSTILFCATKHHVEYLSRFLTLAGYKVSLVYGSLDQVARRAHIEAFRNGRSNILIVTDVAARGIDIPLLSNVINYDFPAEPKIFVHRVGRTARAGRRGWAYSFVRAEDASYLLDLQLFLGRGIVSTGKNVVDYTRDVVLGCMPREEVEKCSEWVTKVMGEDAELSSLKGVVGKSERLYLKTRPNASTESIKRAKKVVESRAWYTVNPLLACKSSDANEMREKLLAKVSGFRPSETVFEIGCRGLKRTEAADVMRRRRDLITPAARKTIDNERQNSGDETLPSEDEDVDLDGVFSISMSTRKRKKPKMISFRDSENFISHYAPTSAIEESGYSISKGTNKSFAEAARGATMDLVHDETVDQFGAAQRIKGQRWDPKKKNFVNKMNDEDGSKGGAPKMIRGESGVKIPATYKSGRFEAWRSSHKTKVPRVGDEESNSQNTAIGNGKRFKHRKIQAPKLPDKARDDYHSRKKRVHEAREKGLYGKAKSELKNLSAIRRDKRLKEKRKAKNARPSRKK